MPTGGGKSITFQVSALALPGICIVITPLIALMKDQVRNLRNRGIKAVTVYSGMSREQILTAFDNCLFGEYKFLYISPERIGSDLFKQKITRMKVNLITVDESHCISQWGYDFRPAYCQIADIRQLLPQVPVLALTATATPQVAEDIQQKLLFRSGSKVFSMSFERKNLAYVVRHTENKNTELLHILKHTSGSAIVYTRNRKLTQEIAQLLQKEGITATHYHAGLNNDIKDIRQKDWVTDQIRVMVATNAFGMGIDKPDVRLVIHYNMPDSPEAYFQEAGRAGRDGQKSYAVLLHTPNDNVTLKKRISDTFPPKEYIRKVYDDVCYYFQMAMGDGAGCYRPFDLEEFCRNFKHFPVQADSALHILSRTGYLEYTDEQDNASRLIFLLTKNELYKLNEEDPNVDAVLHTLLRSYSGLFTDYVYINEQSLALRSNLTRQQVYQILIYLAQRRIISYIPEKRIPYIIYTRERIDSNRLPLTPQVYEERKENYTSRIHAMLHYANTLSCRSQLLLNYFGQQHSSPCGHCDVCLSEHSSGLKYSEFELYRQKILTALQEKPIPAGEVIKLTDSIEQYNKLQVVVRYLIAEEEIKSINGILTL